MTGASVFDLFAASAARFGACAFLHAPPDTAQAYNLEKTDYTYAESAQAVDALKDRYAASNVGPGVRVALAFENRPEFFLHFLAINALGGSILPLSVALSAEELRYQIDHSDAAMIVAASPHLVAMEALVPCPVVGASIEGAPVLNTVTAPGARADKREAALLYTSGTTGSPKGCVLSNEYFRGIGDFYTSLGGLVRFTPGAERIITPLPVTHMNALACSFMAAMQTGGCLVQLDRFHPRSWWQSVRQSRATIMHYLGVMPAMLLSAPASEGDDFSEQVRFAFGAGCDPKHHHRFEERFGVKLIEAWAMTETGAGAWITASHEPRHVGMRCFGKAPAGVEWRLVDEEGRDVEEGAPGELLVRRRDANPRQYFFTEYFKEPAATDEAWAGGWFHTGDVVRVDESGYFYFVDRRKNIIRRSGENIAAIDVESVLMRHDSVANCVVAPVPDEIRGDEVAALVVSAAAPSEGLARSIFDYAMASLVYFKAPAYIAFVDAIPMTASEKVARGAAKQVAREIVERGEAFDFAALKKARKAG